MDRIPESESTARTSLLREQITLLLPELRGFARFLARGRVEADDLVQEALVRALAALHQFAVGTNLRAWLFSILRNAYFEQSRRRRTEQAALERTPLPESSHVTSQESRTALTELERHLWDLPPLLREALVLVGAKELSYEEAAAIAGVPVGTMKARVSRGRTQIAALVGRAEAP